MKKTVKDIEKLDKGLIKASLQSNNLLNAVKLLLEKLHNIQTPEDMTCSDFEELYSLADMIKVYSEHQLNGINHTEMLIDFEV
ncbi:hypothetical protein [Lactobacillus sp. ESL0228]|uniref:hypothetical protein n=1 Tax=Lactobacillus sp. ESL0228 TaxID=2069352 RepID=UPI000EFD54B5|nr:hypothetical protein [Lactobacillus sp. ESL0228]RMC49759.1 hypothetical protein F5ESL0228_03305 [Lactobacillus sp. ESL0228]